MENNPVVGGNPGTSEPTRTSQPAMTNGSPAGVGAPIIGANPKMDEPQGQAVNKKKSGKDIARTLGYILYLLFQTGVIVIATQIIVGYFMFLILGIEDFDDPAISASYSAVSYALAMVLVVMIQKKQHPNSNAREDLGLKGWPTWKDVGLAPAGFVIYAIIATIFTTIFSLFTWFDAEQAQDVGFNLVLDGPDRIIAFITLVIIAPIAEEIIFRGWLYGELRKKLSTEVSNKVGMVISILLVSLLFGLVHLQWNVGVNVFALSIVLCGLREITGTIYAGILLHMLKNGIAFYLLYVLGMG